MRVQGQKLKLDLEHQTNWGVRVGVHQGSVLSPLI